MRVSPRTTAGWARRVSSVGLLALIMGAWSGAVMGAERPTVAPSATAASAAVGHSAPSETAVAEFGYEVVNAYPHDRTAFTQGLVWWDGHLLESTGLFGQSTLRRVHLEDGRVLQRVSVPSQYFAEGLAVLDGRAFQVTWNSGKGWVYALEGLRVEREFSYPGEGWGLTSDGKRLILSDGTARLRFLDPQTLAETGAVTVRRGATPVTQLNELEWVRGEVLANVWHSDRVMGIDPASGRVTRVIDFTGLLPASERRHPEAVLNGIAYDAVRDRLFVTGKLWPKLFEVRLKPRTP